MISTIACKAHVGELAHVKAASVAAVPSVTYDTAGFWVTGLLLLRWGVVPLDAEMGLH